MKQKTIAVILIVLTLAGILGGGYYFFNRNKSNKLTDSNSELRSSAGQIVTLLANKDFSSITNFVNPDKGLLFSPYVNINKTSNRILKINDFGTFITDVKIYNWGFYDGSGLPIKLTSAEYYQKFIFDADFTKNPQVSINKVLSRGNMVNNIAEEFPGASIVEYYLPGTNPAEGGMDWKSLWLVFEPTMDDWWLTAIVHDGWTI